MDEETCLGCPKTASRARAGAHQPLAGPGARLSVWAGSTILLPGEFLPQFQALMVLRNAASDENERTSYGCLTRS